MSEQSNATDVAQEVKKSWGFGTGSVPAEIQAAAAQIIADSRLPGANLTVLLNSFLDRYLPWPFRVTPGIAVDTAANRDGILWKSLSSQRRNYSSSGVFTSWAIAGPNLVKSRTFQVSKVSAPAFRAAMSNECIIGGRTDDGPRGSQLKSGNIFQLVERNQSEPFQYLLYDAYALRPSDAGSKWEAGERSVHLAERAKNLLSCGKE